MSQSTFQDAWRADRFDRITAVAVTTLVFIGGGLAMLFLGTITINALF